MHRKFACVKYSSKNENLFDWKNFKATPNIYDQSHLTLTRNVCFSSKFREIATVKVDHNKSILNCTPKSTYHKFEFLQLFTSGYIKCLSKT